MSFLSEANHQSFFIICLCLVAIFLNLQLRHQIVLVYSCLRLKSTVEPIIIKRMYNFDALKCFKTGLADFKNIFRSHKTLNNATQAKCRLITNRYVLFIPFSWVWDMTAQKKKWFGELKQIFKLFIHFPVITDISEATCCKKVS